LPSASGDSVVLRGHSAPVRCVDFSRVPHRCKMNENKSLLLTCSDDKSVKVWTLPHKKFRCSLIGHANWVRSCKFSSDTESLAASGSDDKTIKIWDIERGCELNTYSDLIGTMNGVGGVNVLDFHTSGTVLASGAIDGSIRMYDVC